jgi:transcription-repair coupling factor (superfamily II helicase)
VSGARTTAYAYLLVPSMKGLTPDAARRLEAIESLEELGAGFVLATHDLEIRGAGEFLGESQSGELNEVGLAMYLDLLERAVEAIKSGVEPDLNRPLAAATEVNLHLPALLPEDYVGDVHTRLTLYKRIAAGTEPAELDELQAEIIDRFGPLPVQGETLLRVARLILTARGLGVRRLDVGPAASQVIFEERNQVDPGAVIRLMQKEPAVYRLEGPLKLRIGRGASDLARLDFAANLLARLSEPPPPERQRSARAR